MATKTSTSSNAFVANLPKIYGGYAGGFIGFVIILAILEQMGVPNKIIGYAFVFLTIGVTNWSAENCGASRSWERRSVSSRSN